MFGKNKREKLFKELEGAGGLPAYKINKICGKIYALAQKGDGEAYYRLYLFAKDNYKNHDINHEYCNWLGLLEKAANSEYPEAVCEYYGTHGFDDMPKRIAMLEKAAAKGYDKACLAVARIYDVAYHGYVKDGLKKLTKEECAQNVIKWLTPAAERGNTDAQIKLGNFLSLYMGDLDGGLKWFELAAEKDVEEAYIGMARIYKKKEEWYKAQKYYKLAADKGNKVALAGLGEVLLVPSMYQDVEKGIKLLEEAVNKGDLYAAHLLSKVYKMGEVVPQDLQKSEFWKNKFEEMNDKILKRNDEIEAQAEKDLAED